MNARRRYLTHLLAAGTLVAPLVPCARGSAINEVAPVLIFPSVVSATAGSTPTIETFLTLTNTSTQSIVARLSFVSGTTCASCRFPIPLSGLDTELIVATRTSAGTTTTFRSMDSGVTNVCPAANGFVVITLEDAATGANLTENLLLGNSVIVDYARGELTSGPALSMAGTGPAQCRKCLSFDGAEYEKLPAVVGGPFIAPDVVPGIDATLTLFTLGFSTGTVPAAACDVIGIDGLGDQFSAVFAFGCWKQIRLADIDPEFTYPNLGPGTGFLEQGQLQLNCTVNGANGGVHGMLSQNAPAGAILRRSPQGPVLASATSWSRLLLESSTVGSSVQFCDQGLGLPDPDADGVGSGCDPCANDPLGDSDGDGFCGDVDNCPLLSNPSQTNTDGDPYGDACDLCPLVAGSGTGDSDHDGVGSTCDPDSDGDGTPNTTDPDDDNDGVPDSDGDGSTDPCAGGVRINCDDNCPFDFNVSQRDRDNDGIGDLCDSSDDLVQGGAASRETTGSGLLPGTATYAFKWEPEVGALDYNVYRGSLTDLPAGSYGTCYRNRIVTTFTSLPENPARGTGFFYLVTPVYSNHEGSLGDRSNGSVRPLTSPCP